MMELNEIDSTRRRRRRQRRLRRHRQPVLTGFNPTATGDSLDECRFPEIERNIISTHMISPRDASAAATAAAATSSSKGGCLSDDDDDDVDLESGELEMVKGTDHRDCRICHLKSGEELSGNEEAVIDLGCSCKGDLGTAHKHCAETWFKIRGNTTCEVCGSAATNVVVGVVGIMINDDPPAGVGAAVSGGGGGGGIGTTTSSAAAAAGVVVVPVGPPPVMVNGENGILWNGRRLVNILLASMILAFVISWLFHSKVLSS